MSKNTTNTMVIVGVGIAAVWYLDMRARATGQAGSSVLPKQASTAPAKLVASPGATATGRAGIEGLAGLATEGVKALRSLFTGGGASAADVAAYNDLGTWSDASAALSDDASKMFGGLGPLYNSDNLSGGSAFNGIPAIGTGVDPDLMSYFS